MTRPEQDENEAPKWMQMVALDMLRSLGIGEPPEDLVDLVVDRTTEKLRDKNEQE